MQNLDETPSIAIGLTDSTSKEAVAAADDFLQSVFGEKPAFITLSHLAGPNDLVQILLDSAHWEALAKLVFSAGGVAFAAQIGTRAADAVWDGIGARFKRKDVSKSSGEDEKAEAASRSLDALIAKTMKLDNSVFLGLPSPNPNWFGRRNIGIPIQGESSNEVLRALGTLTLVGPELERIFGEIRLADPNANVDSVLNSGMGGSLLLLDDGSVEVYLVINSIGSDGQPLRRELNLFFNPDGTRNTTKSLRAIDEPI